MNQIVLTERLQNYSYRMGEEFDGEVATEEFVARIMGRYATPRVVGEPVGEPYQAPIRRSRQAARVGLIRRIFRRAA